MSFAFEEVKEKPSSVEVAASDPPILELWYGPLEERPLNLLVRVKAGQHSFGTSGRARAGRRGAPTWVAPPPAREYQARIRGQLLRVLLEARAACGDRPNQVLSLAYIAAQIQKRQAWKRTYIASQLYMAWKAGAILHRFVQGRTDWKVGRWFGVHYDLWDIDLDKLRNVEDQRD